MQIRCSKSSFMEKENRLYSISLGVASFAGWFGRCCNCFISCNVQAISSFSPSFFVGLGLDIKNGSAGLLDKRSFGEDQDLCIRFTYQRLPRLSKIRTGERMVRLTTLETSYLETSYLVGLCLS